MDFIDKYLNELESVVHNISRDDIHSVVDVLLECWRDQRTAFLIGNGGSAATASHMMNDLNKFTAIPGVPRFRAIALTDNVPLMTAVANDVEYAEIFVEPLKNLLQPGDLLIAMSASGNSPSIVRAVEYAQSIRATVIGFCGHPGGQLARMANLKVVIPSPRIGHQEDGHLILNHVITATLAERIASMSPKALAVEAPDR
jgi:D-sedoheptulose 7-phosphate isomerase